MDAVKRHSQINMAREHAATPRRNTVREDYRRKKQEAAQTHTEGTNTSRRKNTATALALAGNSTPALKHTPSQCCQSARKRIRSSAQQTHTPPAITNNGQGREATHRHRLHFNFADNWIQPTAHTQRTPSKHSPKEPHAEAIPHPSTTRRQNFQPLDPHWNSVTDSKGSQVVHHACKKSDSPCALPLSPPSLHAHGGSSSHRNRQHALQKKHPNPLQCASCAYVVVCACRNTSQRSKNRSRACKGTQKQKMYSRAAWQK
ncbi:hypothetical protein TCDM_11661 [Trypanosoma cruzi Dm28c]|uniref:Uncharacterized protein n=1 Tax=Trypanosoma cruzi Dm28c TaxID=1416333 RepID=V5B489_TRYCR|nr:hypothetical protein TCDM_11661 [Trypanosoma cruzi Dm28c]